MSETKQNYSIVDRIKNILKLDDAGKIQKFFDYELKMHKRAIEQIEQNNVVLKQQHAIELDGLNDDLEDALDNLRTVEENVTIEDISTNADMKAFSKVYAGNIKEAEALIIDIEAKIKDTKDVYGDGVTQRKTQIKKRKARIEAIEGK